MEKLAARLMTVQNNYVLGLASISLLTRPEAAAILQQESAKLGKYEVQFAQINTLFSTPEHRDDAIKSFLIMHLCALIKDTFELCRHHCKEAGRLQEMQAEPWYNFCRLVRNCIAHNFLFGFTDRDRKLMPVRWRGREITAGFDKMPLPLEFFGYKQAWEMFVDVRTFAERAGV